jgi:hypothetical protein
MAQDTNGEEQIYRAMLQVTFCLFSRKHTPYRPETPAVFKKPKNSDTWSESLTGCIERQPL